MEHAERSDIVGCIECGQSVDTTFDHPFAITDEIVLCASCATRRGGAYDSDKEKWTVAPRLEEIPEERRPHP